LLGSHCEKAALIGGPYLHMEVEASLGLASLRTSIYCDKLEEISDLKISVNASAGHIWPAGRYLPSPVLEYIEDFKR